MAKRNFRKQAADPFADSPDETTVDNSWMAADQGIFGDIAKADAQTERIKAYDIFGIVPDTAQPRRVIPSAVRQHWNGDPHAIPDLFVQWVRLVQAETGREFTLGAYLMGDDEQADRSILPDPIENSLLELVDLATSIRREGLTNPITLSPLVTFHQIETGERRWLAYHLLHAFFDGQTGGIPNEQNIWRKIPARVVEVPDVWRQATENNARQNLNAIGRARQFAILMMDLWANDERRPYTFKPPDSFRDEQTYYAQVIELSPPHGKSGMLLSAMGFKHRNAISRYRDLLGLPNDLWRAADDYNCPEGILRKLLKMEPDEARAAFARWLRGARPNVTSGDNSGPGKSAKGDIPNRLPPPPTLLTDPACQRGNRLFSKQKEQKVVQNVKELARLRDGVGQASSATKSQIRQIADEIRRMLDDIESGL